MQAAPIAGADGGGGEDTSGWGALVFLFVGWRAPASVCVNRRRSTMGELEWVSKESGCAFADATQVVDNAARSRTIPVTTNCHSAAIPIIVRPFLRALMRIADQSAGIEAATRQRYCR